MVQSRIRNPAASNPAKRLHFGADDLRRLDPKRTPKPTTKKPTANKVLEATSEVEPGEYRIMFYKAGNSFGIREMCGHKRQVLCVCKQGVGTAKLEKLEKEAKNSIESGEELWKVRVLLKLKLNNIA